MMLDRLRTAKDETASVRGCTSHVSSVIGENNGAQEGNPVERPILAPSCLNADAGRSAMYRQEGTTPVPTVFERSRRPKLVGLHIDIQIFRRYQKQQLRCLLAT